MTSGSIGAKEGQGGCLITRLVVARVSIRKRKISGVEDGGGVKKNIRLEYIPGHPLCGCSPRRWNEKRGRDDTVRGGNRFEKVETSLILRAIKQSVKECGRGGGWVV